MISWRFQSGGLIGISIGILLEKYLKLKSIWMIITICLIIGFTIFFLQELKELKSKLIGGKND